MAKYNADQFYDQYEYLRQNATDEIFNEADHLAELVVEIEDTFGNGLTFSAELELGKMARKEIIPTQSLTKVQKARKKAQIDVQSVLTTIGERLHLNTTKSLKTPLMDDLEIEEIPLSHIAKKRKQWGGVSRVKTASFYEFNARVAMGYIKRSVARKLPTPTKTDYTQVRRSTLGQSSHVLLGKSDHFTYVRGQTLAFEEGLFEAFIQAGLVQLARELSQGHQQGFLVAASSKQAFTDHLRSLFKPSISMFMDLKEIVREFVFEEWENYGEQAMGERSKRLTGSRYMDEAQIRALKDADNRILGESPTDPALLDEQRAKQEEQMKKIWR